MGRHCSSLCKGSRPHRVAASTGLLSAAILLLAQAAAADSGRLLDGRATPHLGRRRQGRQLMQGAADAEACPLQSLREVIAASPTGDGINTCTFCQLNVSSCVVACEQCASPVTNTTGNSVTLNIKQCANVPGEFYVDDSGNLQCNTQGQTFQLSGRVDVLVFHNLTFINATKNPSELAFTLSTQNENGTAVRVAFDLGEAAEGADLMTGDNITLSVSTTAGHHRRLMQQGGACLPPNCFSVGAVRDVIVTDRGDSSGKVFVVGGKPIDITGVVMHVTSMCGVQAPMTTDRLKASLFKPNQNAPSPYATIQGQYEVCSYGKVRYTPNTMKVVPVTLPCTGTDQSGNAYDSNNCGNPELYGWQYTAMQQAAKQLGISDWSKYPSRTLVLPKRDKCGWAGLANVGCDTDCNTWLNSYNKYHDLNAHFHESGHNIGLNHANRITSTGSNEYGDFSDPMGSSWQGLDPIQNKTFYCLAAPNAYKAGWAYAAYNLSVFDPKGPSQTKLAPNVFRRLTIPSMHLTDTNFIYINVSRLPDYRPTWPSGAAPLPRSNQLYISYRVKQPLNLPSTGFDSGMPDSMSQRIWVHSYNATQRDPPRPDPSDIPLRGNLLAVLRTPDQLATVTSSVRADTVFRQDYGRIGVAGDTGVNGIVIKPVRVNATHAVLDVGYFRYNRENDAANGCNDGIDNDLDGLTDDQDPDCGGSTATSPKPSPRPSPRRPSPKPSPRRPSPKPSPRRPSPKPSPRRPSPRRSPRPSPRRSPRPSPRRSPKPSPRRVRRGLQDTEQRGHL